VTVALHMRWTDLAFLHWPVAYDAIRPMVPTAFELGTFDGAAWVGITPFRMTGVRPRFGPPVPTTNDFLELNVRTYVRFRGRPGVYFFSLDAASRLAVVVARVATNLPYRYARMTQTRDGDDVVYTSSRRESSAPSAEFRARYRATGDVALSAPGSFEYWATERYSLFTIAGDSVLRLDIEHEPWALQPVAVDIERNTMARAAGIELPDAPPRAHFSRSLDVVAHLPSRQRAR
jgi:uncharacterized protein YqjF (DUF2071 family)